MTFVVNGREHEWPKWVGWAEAALMGAIVIAIAVESSIPRRPVVVALTLAAALCSFLNAFGRPLRPVAHVVLVVSSVAILNVGAEQFGWATPDGHVQLTLMILVFTVGGAVALYTPPLALAVVVAGAATTMAATYTYPEPEDHGGPVWTIAILVAAMAGLFIRALLTALADLEAAQGELAQQAATEERQRIAREVHDVIAHSLTVTMLHLTAARMAVGRGDDFAATEALEEAERSGRQSLAEVRRTVGLLRADSANGLERPAPLATDLAELVDGFRTAGVAVDLQVNGDLEAVAPTAGLATYRIVQESLANVARHAPGASATVVVDAGPPTTVRVCSSGGTRSPVLATGHGAGAGSGAGLLGMRERAEALGGRCTAGPDGDGWLVEAVLP